jgi:UDPglucose 6-dehydrogenase
LILTEWNEFRNPDFEKINAALKNKIIFDGRNIFDPKKMKDIGYTYFSIGRVPVIS